MVQVVQHRREFRPPEQRSHAHRVALRATRAAPGRRCCRKKPSHRLRQGDYGATGSPPTRRRRVFVRDCLDDRWPPRARRQVMHRAPGRGALIACRRGRLRFSTNTSAISSSLAFTACTSSPAPGVITTTVVVAASTMSNSDWPTPTVSMTIQAGLPRRAHGSAGCERESSGAAIGRHGAHEDLLVGRGVLHSQPVAQHRAARERRHWIEREHRDPVIASHRRLQQRSDQRDLPAPGAPVIADRQPRVPCERAASIPGALVGCGRST